MNKCAPAIRLRILCFIDYYLPGSKAGGPIRTIENLVNQLCDEFEFLIVTRDRDLLENNSYPNIAVDEWNVVGGSKVFYASPARLSFQGLRFILKETPHDILYLNSFFSPVMTTLPLIIKLIGLCVMTPIILAPRGELSAGALALKSIKKKLYLALFRCLKIHNSLIFQSSSLLESKDILSAVGLQKTIEAEDLVSIEKGWIVNAALGKDKQRIAGPLSIVFLSRISPIKNLNYLLLVLGKVKATVKLTIYGPKEDLNYLALCQDTIKKLPVNISVSWQADVKHEQVAKILAKYDVLVLPTLGENFGHVIFESLSVGTPVIISDKTPWQSDAHGSVEVLSLKNQDIWISAINHRASISEKELAKKRDAALVYASSYVEKSHAIERNRRLFLSAINHTQHLL
jgi:glycosyltransferase involved in cell wall biosynthesis